MALSEEGRMEVVEDKVMGRLKVRVRHPTGITRREAVKLLSTLFNRPAECVVLNEIKSSKGSQEVVINAYIYENPADAKLFTPKYRFLRLQPEGRKRS